VAGPAFIPDLRRALCHYGALSAELQRRQDLETARMLSQVAELDREIRREQTGDALSRRRRAVAPSS
jgi:hypothetical protein